MNGPTPTELLDHAQALVNLRERIAKALEDQHYLRSQQGILTLPEIHSAAMADAAMTVVQPEIDQRATEVARLRALWAAVAKDSRERKAEADGRRQHAEELKAENEQLKAELRQVRLVGEIFMERVDTTRTALISLDQAITGIGDAPAEAEVRAAYDDLVATLGLPEEPK